MIHGMINDDGYMVLMVMMVRSGDTVGVTKNIVDALSVSTTPVEESQCANRSVSTMPAKELECIDRSVSTMSLEQSKVNLTNYLFKCYYNNIYLKIYLSAAVYTVFLVDMVYSK